MNVAIVVAAGKGTRLGGERPKQFVELAGIPLIIHTLRQFEAAAEIDQVILVLPADQTAGFQSLITGFELTKCSRTVAGGRTRAQSVALGLAVVDNAEVVAVHDGVRPFVTPSEIDRAVRAAQETGAAILVAPVSDTLKQIADRRVAATVPRDDLRRALTPQCFRLEILRRAYDRLAQVEAAGVDVTDDSILVERLGVAVTIVEGSAGNIKITAKEDLALAEFLLKSCA